MKFLFFNLAVVAALVFLFNPDRADLRAWADRAYEAIGLAKEAAETAVNPPKPAAVAKAAPAQEKNPPVAETPKVAAEPAALVAAPAPEPKAPAPKPTAPKKRAVAEVAPAAPVPTDRIAVQTAPEPALDPAVAKRRAEVLGLDAPAAGPAEETLMSPEQRRRELFSLAEEMELFYVKRLSR